MSTVDEIDSPKNIARSRGRARWFRENGMPDVADSIEEYADDREAHARADAAPAPEAPAAARTQHVPVHADDDTTCFAPDACGRAGRMLYWPGGAPTVGSVVRRGEVNDEDRERILAALKARDAAEQELRDAIDVATAHEASVRELAKLTGLGVNTIQRWRTK